MLNKTVLTGAKARRARVREEMRTAIVDTASKIVAEHGVEGLTIRGVAQELGYSPGALYEYFDSKELLLCSLYFEGADGLGMHCERAIENLQPGASTLDGLHALGHAYREFALNHPELYRLAFSSLKTPPELPAAEQPEDNTDGFGITVEFIRNGIAEGAVIDDIPAPMIATAVWSAVHGFVSLEIGGHITGAEFPGAEPPPPDEARAIRDQMFEVVLRMVLHGFARKDQ